MPAVGRVNLRILNNGTRIGKESDDPQSQWPEQHSRSDRSR
jgi:hypothetical protein